MSMVYQNRTETIEVSGRYTIALNDGMGYLAAGLAGHGIMQLPTFMARLPIIEGRLVPLLLDWCTAPKPLHIVYPPNRHLSNKVRVFVDWLAELFARDDFVLSRGASCKPTILPPVPVPTPPKADQLSSSSSA